MNHPRRFTVIRFISCTAALWAGLGWTLTMQAGEEDPFTRLAAEYADYTRPLLQKFCLDCHSTAKRSGELDLEQFATLADARRGSERWLKVAEILDSEDMPPPEAEQPTPDERRKLRDWVQRFLHAEALSQAGDPGPVVLRRLNNAEYRYTIRELTGVDLNPAREFPADSSAGEGFTNAGNSLAMSSALLAKYLDAGKEIADHAVLLPDGFRFSPQATRRDWTDEILSQIRELYRPFVASADLGVGSAVGNVNVHTDTRLGQAGRLPLEQYLLATLAQRDALAAGTTTIETVAAERGLSPKYLGILWSSLSQPAHSYLWDGLCSRWRNAAPEGAPALAAEIAAWQKGLWTFGPVGLIGRQGGPTRWMEPVSPLVSEREFQHKIPPLADGDTKTEIVLSLVAGDAGDGNEHDFVIWKQPRLVMDKEPDILLRDVRERAGRADGDEAAASTLPPTLEWGLDPELFGKHPSGAAIDAASLCVHAPSAVTVRLPAKLAAGRTLVTTAVLDPESGAEGTVQPELVEGPRDAAPGLLPSEVVVTFSTVTQVFSDRRDRAFARPILAGESSTVRQRIEAAFEEFRRVFPAALCYEQIVPVDEVLTLSLFYREDDHLARLMLDNAQQARLNRLWEELEYVSQSPLLRVTALEILLEVFAGAGVADRSQYNAVEPLRKPFEERALAFSQELIDSEPKHLTALVDFAAQAYRRPLTCTEADDLRGLYRRLREQELSHEAAFRLTLARIFVSAPFLYRLETAPEGTTAAPVSDWELASRLSYFLWSSPPDAELRARAADGTLHEPDVLAAQARRMLGDDRVRRLAIEFGCQYLHIHDFDSLIHKSQEHFPEFADLRGDMYEESIRFLTDLFQRDGSVLNLVDADHTFLNGRLAKFYGIAGIEGDEWRRTDGLRQQGRGGVLALATTLATQSGASRTSPILRGNWICEVLLGEKLPRPPKDVPLLPADEFSTDGLTVRQLVAKHTSDARCATCHQRIDPFGFALEGFDAVGRRRESDLAGRPIDTHTTLPDGSEIDGLDGLKNYVLAAQRDAFLRQFCRKLLGYSLGRAVRLSDEPLLDEMLGRLAEHDYRFSVAVETIIQSPPFRQIRGRDVQSNELP